MCTWTNSYILIHGTGPFRDMKKFIIYTHILRYRQKKGMQCVWGGIVNKKQDPDPISHYKRCDL